MLSEDTLEKTLQTSLKNMKSREGMLGYILRDLNSATIDLKDQTRISDYALISSTAFETAQAVSSLLDNGETSTVILEGGDVKILLMLVNNRSLSIFMEKNVDHDKLLKDLDLL